MLACSFINLLGAKLSLPAQWRGYAMAAIGGILGSSFDTTTIQSLGSWLPTIACTLAITFIYLVFSYAVLSKWSGMNRITAFFAAVPGGLSVISVVAEHYHADTRRVALSHSARLIALLALTPVLLRYVGHYNLPSTLLSELDSVNGLQILPLVLLFLCAGAGHLLAQKLNFPIGMLLFPLILSAIAHATGQITTSIPLPVSALAQIIIGTSVGVRFAGYSFLDIAKDGWLSIVLGFCLAMLALVSALAMQAVTDLEFGPLLLIFLPGGAPELGVIALALNIDPAMVTSHHLFRVLFLMTALSLFVRRPTSCQ